MNTIKFQGIAQKSILTSDARRVLQAQIQNLEEIVGNINGTLDHLRQQLHACDTAFTEKEMQDIIDNVTQTMDIVLLKEHHNQAMAIIRPQGDEFIISPLRDLTGDVRLVIENGLSQVKNLAEMVGDLSYIVFTSKQNTPVDDALNEAMAEAEHAEAEAVAIEGEHVEVTGDEQ